MLTYIDCIKLFAPQWLRAYGTGETVHVVHLAHGRTTIAFTHNFIATLAAVAKEIFRHFLVVCFEIAFVFLNRLQ